MSHHLSIACFSFVAGITPILSLAITRARTPWRSPLASTATLLLIVLARAPQHNGEQREALADSISHKLHPMVEQYAQLFKTGIRTPVLKRPSDIGLDYEDVFFPSLDGIPLEA